MKLNKIMFFFILALPISIVLRGLQLLFTVDYVTGFYYGSKETVGIILLILILLSAFFMGFFARQVFTRPENPPKANIFTSLFSLLVCGAIFNEKFIQAFPVSALPWQIAILKITAVLISVYLLCVPLSLIFKFQIPPLLSVCPIIYLLMKIICDFTVVSKLAFISDNILMIASYCLILLFFLNFGKLCNGINDDICFKKILSYGLPAVMLSLTCSIPNLAVNLILKEEYLHTSISANLSLLLFGILILSLLISYFYQKVKK